MRAGGLNIAAVFHIVDAGVCHEALVMLPNNLIKKQDITGSCFHTIRKMLVSSCWYKRREKSFLMFLSSHALLSSYRAFIFFFCPMWTVRYVPTNCLLRCLLRVQVCVYVCMCVVLKVASSSAYSRTPCL